MNKRLINSRATRIPQDGSPAGREAVAQGGVQRPLALRSTLYGSEPRSRTTWSSSMLENFGKEGHCVLEYASLMKRETITPKKSKRQEAQYPQTEPSRLAELSRSSSAEICSLVAKNPNAPLSALSFLADKFPREVLQNPSLALFLLENPQSLLQFPSRSLQAILWCEDVSPMILRICAGSQDPDIRSIVACSPKTPVDLLRLLANVGTHDVQVLVARHPSTDKQTLEKLCTNAHYAVRVAAMRRCSSFVAVLGDLAQSLTKELEMGTLIPDWVQYRKSAKGFPCVEALYQSGGELALVWVGMSPETPDSILEELCKQASEKPLLRSALLSNPSLSMVFLGGLLSQLKQGAEELGVFFQPNLSEEQQRFCLAQFAPDLEWLATKPIAEWAYEALFQQKKKGVCLGLAKNPALPVQYFSLFFEELDFQISCELAQNPSTPAALLERLAGDWAPTSTTQVAFHFTFDHMRSALRRIVAQNPSIPPSLYGSFVSSNDPWVRKSLALNPALPLAFLEQLSTDEFDLVRAECAIHPSLSVRLCRRLANDSSVDVKQRIASRPDLSPELAHQLFIEAKQTHANLAKNPQTPAVLLEKLVESSPELVACNPNAPPALLALLSQDARAEIQGFVASHENTSEETLKRLTLSLGEFVREQAFFHPSLDLFWLYQQKYIRRDLPF
jgi:hypothetical protein